MEERSWKKKSGKCPAVAGNLSHRLTVSRRVCMLHKRARACPSGSGRARQAEMQRGPGGGERKKIAKRLQPRFLGRSRGVRRGSALAASFGAGIQSGKCGSSTSNQDNCSAIERHLLFSPAPPPPSHSPILSLRHFMRREQRVLPVPIWIIHGNNTRSLFTWFYVTWEVWGQVNHVGFTRVWRLETDEGVEGEGWDDFR